MLGSLHYNEQMEKQIPTVIKTNWIYILLWISKDILIR